MDSQQRFFEAFAGQLARYGQTPEQALAHLWLPFDPNAEVMLGPDRSHGLNHLQPSTALLSDTMQARRESADRVNPEFAASAPIALILVPGFTHETLRNYSWHEVVNARQSPHQITIVQTDAQGRTQEVPRGTGNGLRIAYLRYPRSNAAASTIVPGMARQLRESPTIQRWCAEGRQLVFVGYSNGAPLSLELLAGLARGTLDAGGVLQASRAFLALCGDIGGSYLADDVMAEQPQFLSMQKVVAFAERHPLLARLMGLGTPQLRADMLEGVRSLGHAARQTAITEYRDALPDHLHYFSVAAMLPLMDYRRRWWQFNLDDWSMYRQALITDPITAYHDGQVALPDNLVPSLPHVPAAQQQFLGAVRTHHWGVSYRTFNQGNNRFPRNAFYRALLEVIGESLGLLDPAPQISTTVV